MGLVDGLQSYYKMDEESGTRFDSKGSNDLATAGGAGVGRTVGKLNDAASFNEADYLEAADGTVFNFSGDFTMAGWFRFDPVDDEDRMIAKWKGAAEDRHYLLRWIKTSPTRIELLAFRNSDLAQIAVRANTYGDPTPDGVVYRFIVFGHDTSTQKLFIEVNNTGLDESANPVTGGIRTGTDSKFTIGALSGDSTAFSNDKLDGEVDELGIWNRVLNVNEREALYNSGSGNFYDNTNANDFDQEAVPICWNYTAQYKRSSKFFKMSGPGSFPVRLRVPGNVDISTGKMIDDGRLIDPDEYEIV